MEFFGWSGVRIMIRVYGLGFFKMTLAFFGSEYNAWPDVYLSYPKGTILMAPGPATY